MAPMLGREIEEREHRLFVLCYACNTLFVFDAILFGEDRQRSFGLCARPSVLNIVQI